jgi:hypothetical protein
VDIWVSAISAAIAVVSAVISALFAARANRLAERSARDAYLERVRDWADESVGLLVALNRLCDEPGEDEREFNTKRADLLTRLSSQIERGRWFFPNVLDTQVGEWKEAAYRGYRQPILNNLVNAFDAANEVHFVAASGSCAVLTDVPAHVRVRGADPS